MSLDVAAMTLAEVEALAKRLEDAARVFREARAILGGSVHAAAEPDVAAPEDEDPAAAHRRRQFQPVDDGVMRGRVAQHTHPGGGLTAAERSERQRIMGKRPVDQNLPDDIREAEEAQ